MKYCFIFFILLLSVRTVAQPGHLSVFYPENDLYKKLKVKAVIDSFMIVPANSRIIEYDTSGRELNSYYSSCISCAGYRSFVFTRQGDTLYRTKPSGDTSTGKIFSFERFIYSRTGKIMSYALSHKSYTLEKEIYAKIVEFFYDEKDSLVTRIEYTSHNYPYPVKEWMEVQKKELEMSDVIYYSYKKTPKGLIVIGKEAFGNMEGRETDSFFYDSRHRLLRKSSFAKLGTDGERSLMNLHRVTTYSWKGSTLHTLDYYTYCLAESSQYGCLTTLASDIDKKELIYDKNGLLQAEYSYYPHNGEKYLVSRYYYLFYE